jgi:hypothetical protein
VGQEQVGGHDTVHLRLTAGTVDYAVELCTFDWLPRTDENLSHFDLTPPAGFTKNGAGTATKGDQTATAPARH